MGIIDSLKHGWNAFTSRDPTKVVYKYIGPSSTSNQDRPRLTRGNEKSIVTSIYNRLAVDVAATTIVHAKMDDQNRFLKEMDTGLNNCLTLEANIDQTSRSFISDLVISLCDEGYVAAVPVDTSINPDSGSFDIETMRVGQILEWFPEHVRVRVYNQNKGIKEDIIVPKKTIAIIENPFYSIMNEPNSTLQRLIRKLNIMDEIDERTGSGKLDLIIQLPYAVRSETRRGQAEKRRQELEKQLKESGYGIAYSDTTEKIIQLNRTIDNKILSQIEYLTGLLFSQLGITKEIMEGTADEKTMLNYYNRTVEPILSAIADEYKRKFITKTARTQKQTIFFYRDPFRLVPINDIAEIADKFTRNEILTSNEVRQIIGMKPSDNPAADDLRNKNIIATEYGNVNGNDLPEIEERAIDNHIDENL